MNPTELFWFMGRIAGIAGIALAAYFLITRAVLARMPAPARVPFRRYFDVIDKIVLYAFVVALAGLVLYAILENGRRADSALVEVARFSGDLATLEEKHKQLNQEHNLLSVNYEKLRSDYDLLNDRLSKIDDPLLKERSAAFEVMSSDVTFDLSNWSLVPEEELRTRKRSSMVTRAKREVYRAQREAKTFVSTYAIASAFDPDFSCKTHVMKAIPNKDSIQSGKESLRRWVLEYDVSNEPLFRPFKIDTETTSWNTMQNPSAEHEGTLILFSTRKACLDVIFPPQKRPIEGSIECKSYPLEQGRSPALVANPRLEVAKDRSRLKWEITEPKLGFHYEIYWKW